MNLMLFGNKLHITLMVEYMITDGTPFRKNHAGIGYTYDSNRDAFISPKPFNSWILNEDTCLWDAPVAIS
jgi:hypothetical protein